MLEQLFKELLDLNHEIDFLMYKVNEMNSNPDKQNNYSEKSVELHVSKIENKLLTFDNFFNRIHEVQDRYEFLRNFFVQTFIPPSADEDDKTHSVHSNESGIEYDELDEEEIS